MTKAKYEPSLNGWDDGKIYFFDENGVTRCVDDHPELLARLTEMCREHFRQEAVRQGAASSE
jgi:hypothetical protein